MKQRGQKTGVLLPHFLVLLKNLLHLIFLKIKQRINKTVMRYLSLFGFIRKYAGISGSRVLDIDINTLCFDTIFSLAVCCLWNWYHAGNWSDPHLILSAKVWVCRKLGSEDFEKPQRLQLQSSLGDKKVDLVLGTFGHYLIKSNIFDLFCCYLFSYHSYRFEHYNIFLL